jgi:hypothetical protein
VRAVSKNRPKYPMLDNFGNLQISIYYHASWFAILDLQFLTCNSWLAILDLQFLIGNVPKEGTHPHTPTACANSATWRQKMSRCQKVPMSRCPKCATARHKNWLDVKAKETKKLMSADAVELGQLQRIRTLLCYGLSADSRAPAVMADWAVT